MFFLRRAPWYAGYGLYTFWYTLKVQNTQCLSALVRVYIIPPWVSLLAIIRRRLIRLADWPLFASWPIAQIFVNFHKFSPVPVRQPRQSITLIRTLEVNRSN